MPRHIFASFFVLILCCLLLVPHPDEPTTGGLSGDVAGNVGEKGESACFVLAGRTLPPYEAFEENVPYGEALHRAAAFVMESLSFEHLVEENLSLLVQKKRAHEGGFYSVSFAEKTDEGFTILERYEVSSNFDRIFQNNLHGLDFEIWPEQGLDRVLIGEKILSLDIPLEELPAVFPVQNAKRSRFWVRRNGVVKKYEGDYFLDKDVEISATNIDWDQRAFLPGERRVSYVESSSAICRTEKGVGVGSTKEDVLFHYGPPASDRYGLMVYKERSLRNRGERPSACLAFSIDAGRVERLMMYALPEGMLPVFAGERPLWGTKEWTVEKNTGKALSLPLFQWGDTLRIVGDPLERSDWPRLNTEAIACFALRFENRQRDIPDAAFYCNSKILSIEGRGVRNIGKSAFNRASSLVEVSFPRVEQIGNRAFSDCAGLWEIDVPQIVSIGERAFSGCYRLTSMRLPASLRRIAHNAFEGCSSLDGFFMDSKNRYYRSDGGVLVDIRNERVACFPEGMEEADSTIAKELSFLPSVGWYSKGKPASADMGVYGLSGDTYYVLQEEDWPVRKKREICRVRLLGWDEYDEGWNSEILLEVVPRKGKAFLLHVPSVGGYREYMELEKFVSPSRREIFLFSDSGGSAGYIDFVVVAVEGEKVRTVFPYPEDLQQFFPMEGEFFDGYRARIRFPVQNQEYFLDFSERKGYFSALYDEEGKLDWSLVPQDEGHIKMITPADVDGDGLSELVAVVPHYGDYKRYYFGDSIIVFKYHSSGWKRIHNWFAPAPGIRIILDEAPEESSGDVRSLREGDGCR